MPLLVSLVGGIFLKIKKLISFFIILLIIFSFSGCDKLDKVEVKMGLKNQDFDYMQQGKIKKIIIQSTRDKGFRFVVTSSKTINEIYDILSSAKPAQSKSTLDPDYTFDLYKSDTVKFDSFNYIAGLDKKDGGNLYNGKKSYIVSKRIDSDILKDFWDTDAKRLPTSFSKVYYPMISDALSKYEATGVDKNKKVGINIKDDVEAAKFILSTEVEDFKKKLDDNVSLITDDKDNNDIDELVSTYGYKSDVYKSIITFYDKKTMIQKKYYLIGTYSPYKDNWGITIYESEPNDF